MNIVKLKNLLPNITERLKAISKSQNKEYHLAFDFDFSDNDCIYYLCYDNDKIRSALELFKITENVYEAIAYTHIRFTNMGYFTAIYNHLINDLNTDVEISFACDKNFPPTAHIIEKFSLQYSSTELMMSLALSEYNSQPVKPACDRSLHTTKHESLTDTWGTLKLRSPLVEGFLNNTMEISCDDFNNYKIFYNGKKIGSFITEEMSENNVYLFGFEILKKYRQKGFGKLSMGLALQLLKGRGIKKLYLQVSPENKPAYRIYKGLGFKINAEINYYKKAIVSTI